MEKRGISTIIIATAFFTIFFSIDFNATVGFNYGDTLFSLYNKTEHNAFFKIDAALRYVSNNFTFLFDIAILNNKIYNDPFSESYYGGFYFAMNDAKLKFKVENFQISLGKTNMKDVVYTPYSLFVSSVDYLRNTIEYKYEDGRFTYITKWLQLNNLQYVADPIEKYRSANFKVYAAKFDKIRFGYEEINVYVGKEFDFEYFFNPIPGFFIQYVNDAGRPFSEGIGEANYIMGFFLDYLDDSNYFYAQILIDDINMNRFFYPTSYQNPDKIAWSIGGIFSLNKGKIGLYHAGATKYTFQPSAEFGKQRYYGYTYFPYITYQLGDKTMIFPLEFLYAGYKYGENNVAFLVEYEPKDIKNLKLSLEYVVLGERSPVNPWGDRVTYIEGTHLLDDPVLEYRLFLGTDFKYNLLDTLSLCLNSTVGYIWNRSELVDVDSDDVRKPLMRPKSGNNQFYFSTSFSLILKFSF